MLVGLTAKNAILIVEFAKAQLESGPAAGRRGAGGRAAASAPDPDDVVRVHLRLPAAVGRRGRGSGGAADARHDGRHRHAGGDTARHLLRPGAVRVHRAPGGPREGRPWARRPWPNQLHVRPRPGQRARTYAARRTSRRWNDAYPSIELTWPVPGLLFGLPFFFSFLLILSLTSSGARAARGRAAGKAGALEGLLEPGARAGFQAQNLPGGRRPGDRAGLRACPRGARPAGCRAARRQRHLHAAQ